MENGWIKLHRSIKDWEWWYDLNTRSLFITCLVLANYADTSRRGILVRRGSFTTTIEELAKESCLTIKQARTAIKHLEKTGEMVIEGANKFSMITICNYDRYQCCGEGEGQRDGQREGEQRANKGQTKGKQRANKGRTKGNS